MSLVTDIKIKEEEYVAIFPALKKGAANSLSFSSLREPTLDGVESGILAAIASDAIPIRPRRRRLFGLSVCLSLPPPYLLPSSLLF